MTLLKKSLSAALVTHMMLVAWALAQPDQDIIAPRSERISDVMTQPTWVFPEEPKKELTEVKKESALPTTVDAEPVLAVAPKVEPKKKVTPKNTVVKKRKKSVKKRARAPKKKAVAIIASTSKDAPQVQSASVDLVAEKGTEAPVIVTKATLEPVAMVKNVEPIALLEKSPIDLDGLRLAYIGKLNARFQEERVYPRAAKRAGIQGEVLLEVVIDENGRIKKARVLKSSGHSILDAAAVEAITDVDNLPAPPSSLRWKDRPMRVPFVYRLS